MLGAVVVQDPSSGFTSDQHAGAGVPGLLPNWMQASSRPTAVQARSIADEPSIRTRCASWASRL